MKLQSAFSTAFILSIVASGSACGSGAAAPGSSGGAGSPSFELVAASGQPGAGHDSPPTLGDRDDSDDDGFFADEDCDDEDPRSNPAAVEVCDGKDNDCDGMPDNFAVDARSYFRDADGDGVGDPNIVVKACEALAGYVTRDGDCDDNDPNATILGCFEEAEPENAIYVDAANGDDDNAGDSPEAAVRTILAGMSKAAECEAPGCTVLVQPGRYFEQLGLDVVGGTHLRCNAQPGEACELSAEVSPTVRISSTTRETVLDGFTIMGTSRSTEEGAASVGIFVSHSNAVSLKRLTVIAGEGGPGSDAEPASQIACNGHEGGAGGIAHSSGKNDPAKRGHDRQLGGEVHHVVFTSKHGYGIVNGERADNGGPGGDGKPGPRGEHGQPLSNAVGSFDALGSWTGLRAGNASHGLGGGGGGGGQAGRSARYYDGWCVCHKTRVGGNGGKGGKGGCGGAGGKGGFTGGGSFGIVVFESSAVVTDSLIQLAQAGPGGRGSPGVDGSTGATGEPGVHPADGGIKDGDGGDGGKGGKGGDGGHGAGGSGGPSIGIFANDGSFITDERNTVRIGDVTPAPGGAAVGDGFPGAPGLLELRYFVKERQGE